MKHVEFHQPIPDYVLEEARAALPAEWFNESTTGSPITTTNVPDEWGTFFTETLQHLNEIYCPFDCNGNGQCQNGMCLLIVCKIPNNSYYVRYCCFKI